MAKELVLAICFVLQLINVLAVPIHPNLFSGSRSRERPSKVERMLPEISSKPGSGAFANYYKRMATITRTVALHIKNSAPGFQIRQGQYMHLNQGRLYDGSIFWTTRSKNRLTLPLSSFPNPPSGGIPTIPTPAPHPLPSPSPTSNAAWLDNSAVEAFPEPSTGPESKGYEYLSLGLQLHGVPSPGPDPFPSPQSVGRDYKDGSMETSPEPSPELQPLKTPFTYAPFDYDEFEESGYNPWRAIYIFVRRLISGL